MTILNFDWSNKAALKENLLKWAYDENLILLEDDEDVLFFDNEWMGTIFPYMFDEKCIKRDYIIFILKNYIRDSFSRRRSLAELETIQELFIDEMQDYCSVNNDQLIKDAIAYFLRCKTRLEKNKKI
ncbi:hypothetical protein [Chryseobacterium mucoviscidosis]|uniref:Uncharacterized protein n=1 Tax=Chryseobacterium mucoviscidosis TaxID=1945581 RepID=A0A202C0I4_9FLAO|nr:hypothetical protein [Chryseobacterium mucoviscidosis]OVE57052.1 hypothetical protein B0E34_10860 [Chryseobacterium mucoviscidosis]